MLTCSGKYEAYGAYRGLILILHWTQQGHSRQFCQNTTKTEQSVGGNPCNI